VARAPQRVSIFPILTVNFVGTLGFSIVMPSLVFLVTRFGGNALVFGLMGATYSFFQLLAAPVLGRLSDRYGRRRILLLSELGTLVSWAVFLVAVTLPALPLANIDSRIFGGFTLTLPLVVLFLARALAGVTGGNVSIANAYLADISADDNRSANFGKMAVASNLGFVFGPALAGLLGAAGMGEIFTVVAALLISAVACLIIAFGLPDSTPCMLGADPEHVNVRKLFGQAQKECFSMPAARKLSLAEILMLPSMKLLLAVYFLVFFAFNLFYVAFPVYAATGIRWSLSQIGVYFAAMGFMMALVQGPVLDRLSRHWSERRLVLGGSVLLAASFPFFTSSSAAMIYSGTALLAIGNGIMWPSLLAILSRTTERSMQGAVQGFASSAGAVASIAGLLLGGALYQSLGNRVFLVAAILVALTCGLSFLLPAKDKASDE
jgi:DHA1 family tetracycline resistance protein-like MFS transporter